MKVGYAVELEALFGSGDREFNVGYDDALRDIKDGSVKEKPRGNVDYKEGYKAAVQASKRRRLPPL